MITRRTNLALVGAVLLILAVASPGYLQAQSRKKQPKLRATLFDEFGAVGYCDVTARLDNFAIQLQNSPKQQGFLLAYAPPGAGERILENLKDYLVNSRGIDEARLTTIYGGRNKELSELKAQLWIAPEGVSGPVPVNFDVKPEQFKGMFYEQDGYDEIPYPDAGADDLGFYMGVLMEGFADIFKHQPRSVTYVVGYNGRTSAPGAWKRIAQTEIEELTKLGFEASRFKLIFGGESKEAKVQVWIQPSVEPLPVKDAGPETSPKTSIEMSDFDEGALGDAKYERAAFNRVLESLRAFPDLRAVIIVRLRLPPTKEELEAEAALEGEWPVQMRTNEYGVDEPLEIEEPKTPPADVLKLIDKWKSELAVSHKIREDRFVVLYSKALPGYSSSLEAWLIPPGEDLPDPEKKLKEWEQEEKSNSKPAASAQEATTVKSPFR